MKNEDAMVYIEKKKSSLIEYKFEHNYFILKGKIIIIYH